jgi:DNA polymerase-3 subunit gamma/tau
MTLVRMLAFRPGGGAGVNVGPSGGTRTAGNPGVPSPAVAPIVRPTSAGAIDPVQWSRVIGDLDVTGAARQLATNCALLEHNGTLMRLALDRGGATLATSGNKERLTLALAKFLGGHVKLEFVEGAAPVETPSQHGERRSAEALEAARRTLDDDPKVREMKARFGATLHPESVRPLE